MPRLAPLILLLVLLGCRAPGAGDSERIVDLTHPFDSETIYWPTAEGFRLHSDSKGWTQRGYYYEANSFATAEHGGTHLDAPIHFAQGQWTVDEIPPEQLIGPGIVVDVSAACAADRDHLVSVAELQAWEARNGRIPTGAIVLLSTGFGARWPDREGCLGTAERGPGAIEKLHFPGLDPAAARWLVEERAIGAVGLDTASIDHGPARTFEAQQALFRANVPALENVAHLDRLPARGFEVIALPMKIRGGSSGPLRIVARVPGR